MNELIKYLERAAYSLECCDSTNTYAEAQKIRGWVKELQAPRTEAPPTRYTMSYYDGEINGESQPDGQWVHWDDVKHLFAVSPQREKP